MNFRLLPLILLLYIQGFLTLENFSVTCATESICVENVVFKKLRCFYSNINITTGFWFSKKQSENWRQKEEPEDLMLDSDYAGRVSQLITNNQSELTITDLRETDSGEYQLMFIMKDGVKHLGSVAVNLTVTGVSNSGCWNVIYPSRSVCALVGSTVDIPSTYSHPTGLTVEKTLWHHREFIDLREEQQFAGRVEYVGNTLRIKDVKISDSGEYRFRIITDTPGGKYSGSPGVVLTVTDTNVTSRPDPVVEGENVILGCLTQCTLDNKHTYTWYKNGQLVTDGFTLLNKLYLDSVSSEEIQEYSCAVGETINRNNETTDSSVFGHLTVCMLVFLSKFLIIGSLWTWFLIRTKMN